MNNIFEFSINITEKYLPSSNILENEISGSNKISEFLEPFVNTDAFNLIAWISWRNQIDYNDISKKEEVYENIANIERTIF